jgi:hypothetical protein
MPTQTNAPTGVYAVSSPIPFILVLRTNGTYEVRWPDVSTNGGKWQWNCEKQEFRLTPPNKEFPFDLRRLRLDRDDQNCLQWIPVPTPGPSGAKEVVDYLRFKRQ